MPVIFGQEITGKKALVIGGVVIAGVVGVVYLRSRAHAQGADTVAQPTDQPGGMSVGAPSQGVADAYQNQMSAAQQQADAIANQYQQNLVTQQQKQFDFQQKMQELLAPDILKEQQSELAVETHFNTAASKAAVSCPGNASLRTGPDGQLYCRQKTSGGILGIPVGDIARTVQGFVGGVEAAAPEIGYSSAKAAATYYTGKYFPASGPTPAKANASQPIITKVNPTPNLPTHGYEEIHA